MRGGKLMSLRMIFFSKNVDDHLRDISLVLGRIIALGLKLKLKKCVWAQYEVEYLGNLINRTGIPPAPSKIETFPKYPVMTSRSKDPNRYIASH